MTRKDIFFVKKRETPYEMRVEVYQNRFKYMVSFSRKSFKENSENIKRVQIMFFYTKFLVKQKTCVSVQIMFFPYKPFSENRKPLLYCISTILKTHFCCFLSFSLDVFQNFSDFLKCKRQQLNMFTNFKTLF